VAFGLLATANLIHCPYWLSHSGNSGEPLEPRIEVLMPMVAYALLGKAGWGWGWGRGEPEGYEDTEEYGD